MRTPLIIQVVLLAQAFCTTAAADTILTGRLLPAEDKGELENAWIRVFPAFTGNSDDGEEPWSVFYRFPDYFGIWYRPMPLDRDGRFEYRLPPGRHIISAGARGHLFLRREFMVPTGVARIELDPIVMAWGGLSRLRVRALFPDGTPCSRRTLSLTAAGKLFDGTEEEDTIQTSTDDEGYCVVFCRPGQFEVCVRESDAVAPTGTTIGSDRVFVEIQDEDLEDVILRLKPAPEPEKKEE